ncbi:MAG TPA: hypothetical protein VK272_02065 [Solirubrobacteraceae bacterium]|nr:hypothetical protein [Solirubrobacteraceae bacterium]
MSILPQLERDLLRAADRRLSTGRPARTWRSRRSVALALVLAAVALVGAGGGELLLAPGKTVQPAFVLPANPAVGLGQPRAASLALLPLRPADPAGGPPWGMRVIQTTRGLVCIQAGRVVDGRLGALGIGYAFKGDGRFHPFAPADAISVDACATVDRNDRAFQPGAPTVVTADGLPLAGENLYPYQRVHCDLPDQEDWGVRCPQADLREVAVGLLGPDAASIRVNAPAAKLVVTPYGPDGAYLIVLPAPPHANTGHYGFLGRKAPGTPTLTVTYRNGSTCELPTNEPRQQCSPEGIERSSGPPPSAAQVKSAVHVRYQARMVGATPPLSATGPEEQAIPGVPKSAPGKRAHSPGRGRGRTLHPGKRKPSAGVVVRVPVRPLRHDGQPVPGLLVTFTARVGAPNISSGYDVVLEVHAAHGCAAPSMIVAQPTQSTIAAGQHVRFKIPLESNCRASYLGRVFYASSSGRYSEGMQSDRAGEGPLYEVINAGLLRGRGVSTFGVTVARFHISVP